MTYEEMRISYQSDGQMVRAVFAMLQTSEALRKKDVARWQAAEEQLAAATAPRRKHRQVEEK